MKFATVFAVAIIMDAAVVSEANLRGNGRAPPQSRGLKENKKGKPTSQAGLANQPFIDTGVGVNESSQPPGPHFMTSKNL